MGKNSLATWPLSPEEHTTPSGRWFDARLRCSAGVDARRHCSAGVDARLHCSARLGTQSVAHAGRVLYHWWTSQPVAPKLGRSDLSPLCLAKRAAPDLCFFMLLSDGKFHIMLGRIFTHNSLLFQRDWSHLATTTGQRCPIITIPDKEIRVTTNTLVTI